MCDKFINVSLQLTSPTQTVEGKYKGGYLSLSELSDNHMSALKGVIRVSNDGCPPGETNTRGCSTNDKCHNLSCPKSTNTIVCQNG